MLNQLSVHSCTNEHTEKKNDNDVFCLCKRDDKRQMFLQREKITNKKYHTAAK